MTTNRSSSFNSQTCMEIAFQVSFDVSSSLSKHEVATNCMARSSRMCLSQGSMFSVASNRSDSLWKEPQNKFKGPSAKHLIGDEVNVSLVFKFRSWIL